MEFAEKGIYHNFFRCLLQGASVSPSSTLTTETVRQFANASGSMKRSSKDTASNSLTNSEESRRINPEELHFQYLPSSIASFLTRARYLTENKELEYSRELVCELFFIPTGFRTQIVFVF